MSRYMLFAFVALLALPFMGAVYGNDGDDGDDSKRIVASVHGMGQLLEWEWGHSSEVRIMAVRTSSGRVSGTITQVDLGSGTTYSRVTCLRPSSVPGSDAIEIGGVIVSSYMRVRGRGIHYIVDDLGTGKDRPFDRTGMGIGTQDFASCRNGPNPVDYRLAALVGGDFKVERPPHSWVSATDELGRRAVVVPPRRTSSAQVSESHSLPHLDTWILLVATASALLAAGFVARRVERRQARDAR